MKLKIHAIACATAATVLALPTFAQETSLRKAGGNDPHAVTYHETPNAMHHDQTSGAAKASDIIGMTVKNYQDEKLGKVEEIAVDLETGRIVEVIVSAGGVMGMGETFTAVPPGALHHDAMKKVIHLDADKAKLKAAPKYDNAQWDYATQSNRVTEVYTYYGERPYFVGRDGMAEGFRTNDMDAKLASQMPRNMDGTINTEAGRSVDRVRNVEIAQRAGEYSTNSNRLPDGTWMRERRETSYAWSKLGRVEKASKLIGKPVKNLQNEKIGKVDNLLVDLGSGRVVVVIVSAGGFMGVGDDLSPVPPTAFSMNESRDTLQLDVSKETLKNSPHFTAKQWPDFNQPDYVGRTYSAYHVEPYFNRYAGSDVTRTTREVRVNDGADKHTTGTAQDADNTGRNVRDRDNATLTPMDQGNSQADIDTTASIRKDIIANDKMSVNAKNVKIITKDGQVTLRGPVRDEEEKRMIGEIAQRFSTAASVNNQLEVEANTSGTK